MSPRTRRPPLVELYLVLRADGTLKRTSNKGMYAKPKLCVYQQKHFAIRQATDDGDSVVLVRVGAGRKPVFIKGELVDGDA